MMKKLTLLIIALVAISGTALAQNKPHQGSFGTEIQFNPFDQDGETFKLDALKFRYFLTDRDAIRLKLGINLKNGKFTDRDEQGQENDIHSYESDYKYSTGDFKLDLGYERHFDLGKRMSIYAGASVGLTRHFASTTMEGSESYRSVLTSVKGEIKNGAILPSELEGEVDIENLLDMVNDRAYLGFNAAVFTGLDFYVYKGLYVGTELGLSFNTQGDKKMKYELQTISDEGYRDNFRTESTDKLRQTEFKVYIEPVLRLGWSF